jgi:elongation factor Ts
MEAGMKMAIMEVRRKTLASIVACKKALESHSWDVEKACYHIAKAIHDTKSNDKSHDCYGVVALYSYEFGRLGVMVELSCESGYVAKSHDFVRLAHTVAVHVAWANPKYIDRSQIDHLEIETARDNFKDMLAPTNGGTLDQGLVDLSMERSFYPKFCLLDQMEMKETHGKKTIGKLIGEMKRKTGEKIVVKRFARFRVGEQL